MGFTEKIDFLFILILFSKVKSKKLKEKTSRRVIEAIKQNMILQYKFFLIRSQKNYRTATFASCFLNKALGF